MNGEIESDADVALGTLIDTLADLTESLRGARERLRECPDAHRRIIYRGLALEFGHVGDLAHEHRRVFMRVGGVFVP